jgi:hypothetical protein
MDSNLKIEQIKSGAVIEMINNELQRVYDDIADPNKEGKSARKVSVEVVFAPSEDALVGTCVVRVKSTLGKQRNLSSTVFFGSEAGKGVCTEKDRNQQMFNVFEASNDRQ